MRPYRLMSIDEMKRRRRIERTAKIIFVSSLIVVIAAAAAVWVVANAAEPHGALLYQTDAPETEAEGRAANEAAETAEREPEATPETESIPKETESASQEEEETEETGASEAQEMKCLGTFTMTAYCGCEICCGKWSGGPTASGVMPKAGRTIAVNPSVIPMGSRVYIDGLGEYVAEDTGSAIKGRRIDIFMATHQEACWFADGAGKCERTVYLIPEEDS